MAGTSLSFRTKILVSVVAVGSTAAVAGLGTYSSFSATTNVSSPTATSEIVLTANNTSAMTAGVANMLAGDSHEMTLDLVNGSDGIGSFSLAAAGTGTELTSVGGLQVGIRNCDQAWTGTVTHVCGGTESLVLAPTDVASLAAPGTALTNMANANGATNHLLLTVTLPSTVDNTYMNLSDTISWAFTAEQRAGSTI